MNTTKTAQFTPGPLKAVQIIIENSSCTWAVQRKSMREQWGKPSIATYIDNEADARLFAAAPAMYEALQAIEARLQGVFDSPALMRQGMLTHDKSADVIRFVRAALAQAEGR